MCYAWRPLQGRGPVWGARACAMPRVPSRDGDLCGVRACATPGVPSRDGDLCGVRACATPGVPSRDGDLCGVSGRVLRLASQNLCGVRGRVLRLASPPGTGTCAGCVCVLRLGSPPGRGQGPQGADGGQKGPERRSPRGLQGAPRSRMGPAGGRNVSEAAPGSWELRTCSCPLPELSSAAPVRATAASCPGQLKLLFNSFGRTYLFNLHCRILFKSWCPNPDVSSPVSIVASQSAPG